MKLNERIELRKMAFTGDDVMKSRIRCYEMGLRDMYAHLLPFLLRAEMLIGNPGTNISGSTDIACIIWHEDFNKLNKELEEYNDNNK